MALSRQRFIWQSEGREEIVRCKIYYDSPAGCLEIVQEGDAICRISFGSAAGEEKTRQEATALLMEARSQLEEYFAGKRREFALPLALKGTEFQLRVWDCLQQIPYGETRSYGEIARMAGNPKACRAVGMANNRNPVSIVVPCHRVIGANGSMVGYGGGLSLKKKLLLLEQGAAWKK